MIDLAVIAGVPHLRDLSAYALDDFSRTKHVALNVAR